jgi:hypothetical protein
MDQDNGSKKAYPIVAALVDLGAAWAAHGLDAGKLSLENSAKALTRTAKTFETLAREIEKKTQRPTA